MECSFDHKSLTESDAECPECKVPTYWEVVRQYEGFNLEYDRWEESHAETFNLDIADGLSERQRAAAKKAGDFANLYRNDRYPIANSHLDHQNRRNGYVSKMQGGNAFEIRDALDGVLLCTITYDRL